MNLSVTDVVEGLGHRLPSEVKDAIRGAEEHLFGSGRSGLGRIAKGIFPGLVPGRAPVHPGLIAGPHIATPLIQAGALLGEAIQGAQPYSFAGYKTIAAGTAEAKGATIVDFFATAVTPAFTTDYQFPNPFQASRLRFSITTAAVNGALDDASWQETLQVVFLNQTEIARSSLNSFGLRTTQTDGTGSAIMGEQMGVAWPVFYEKNVNYQMQLSSQTAVAATTTPFSCAYHLDGWVIQGGLANMKEGAVVRAVAERIGAPVDVAIPTLRRHLVEANILPMF